MIINYVNIFLAVGFLLLIWEYKVIKDYFGYLIFFLLLIVIIFNNFFWDTYFFYINNWKILFLTLITISFFIVFELCKEQSFDVYSLLILTFIGSSILVLSDNLLSLYLGLELQTFSIFILIAKNRSSIKSSEAGLKYFMLGALSSGFYLLGLVILFNFGFSLNLSEIIYFYEDIFVLFSTFLIIFSLFFKLTLFPLHFWVPDIYEGSSWDIISLISTLPKISVVCVLIQLFQNSSIILIACLFSITIGTLGALNQSKMKRFIAYSGISHMGFTILGYIIYCENNYIIGSFYLLIYILNILAMFIIISENINKNKFIIELGGIKSINKIMAISLVLITLSIAGIPPLSGFLSKWFLIWSSIDKGYVFSSFIMVIFSIISIGYYLRIVKTIYFQSKDSYFIWNEVLSINKTRKDLSFLLLGFNFFCITFIIIKLDLFINILNSVFYLI